LRVRWPSGIVQELTDLAPNQLLSLREPAQIMQARFQSGLFQGRFRGAKNASYVVETSEDLIQWRPSPLLTHPAPDRFEELFLSPAKARFYRIKEP
jgi:hypothetical protein